MHESHRLLIVKGVWILARSRRGAEGIRRFTQISADLFLGIARLVGGEKVGQASCLSTQGRGSLPKAGTFPSSFSTSS
ncbi:MAG: hypothetical protein ACQKBT_02965, partial [Puniceicoccales bacterium]